MRIIPQEESHAHPHDDHREAPHPGPPRLGLLRLKPDMMVELPATPIMGANVVVETPGRDLNDGNASRRSASCFEVLDEDEWQACLNGMLFREDSGTESARVSTGNAATK